MTFLERIVESKKREIEQIANGRFAKPRHAPPSFAQAIRNSRGPALIAEIKKASPSKGLIRPDFEPVEIAQTYQKSGAAALSVLTEREFFLGDPDFIPRIRASVDLPILRKDFILHEKQIEEALSLGASAVLLIAAILSPSELKDFAGKARELGLEALIEIHSEDELRPALEANPVLLGINNRDLRTFKVDTALTFRLRPLIPSGVLVVSESGISKPEQILALRDVGIDAVLIGEAFMASPDISAKVKELFP